MANPNRRVGAPLGTDVTVTLAGGSDGTNATVLKTDSSGNMVANQGTKTATATNGWLVTPYTPLGDSMSDDTINAQRSAIVVNDGGSGAVVPAGFTNADEQSSNTGSLVPVEAFGMEFNGSTFDRRRANISGTLLASAARTATTSSADQTNYNGRGCHVIINATASAATPSVVPTIEGKDAVTGNYYTILTGTAITGAGTTVLKVYPGITPVANGAASDMLPRVWRLTMTAADADSLTYSAAFAVTL